MQAKNDHDNRKSHARHLVQLTTRFHTIKYMNTIQAQCNADDVSFIILFLQV